MMSDHNIHIETVFAEELLQLPEGVFIRGAWVDKTANELVLIVASKENLGAKNVTALYGNREEDEKRIHFGMFEPRPAS